MPLKIWYFVFVIGVTQSHKDFGVTLGSEDTDNDPTDRQEKSKLY